jgi:hypothetical protein
MNQLVTGLSPASANLAVIPHLNPHPSKLLVYTDLGPKFEGTGEGLHPNPFGSRRNCDLHGAGWLEQPCEWQHRWNYPALESRSQRAGERVPSLQPARESEVCYCLLLSMRAPVRRTGLHKGRIREV